MTAVLACDLAKRSGFAWRLSGELVAAACLEKLEEGAKGFNASKPWRLKFFPINKGEVDPPLLFPDDLSVYAMLPKVWFPDGFSGLRPMKVAIERGHGEQFKSIDGLAWRRGYLTCAVHNAGPARVFEVNNKTWQRVVGAHFGETFPNESKGAKRLSVALARRQGLDIPAGMHDVADAANLSLAVQLL